MMRSLYSGVAGLKTHQTRMDVIGNNIANVNTVGFKGSNVNFADTFYQTTSSATGFDVTTGAAGTNAKQIGLGSQVASITTNITEQGGTSSTNRALDIAINGDSFLIVKSGGATYFSKSGAFNVDANGTLYSTTNGGTIQGWLADNDGNVTRDVVKDLKVMSPENMYYPPEPTKNVVLQGNINKTDKDLVFQQSADFAVEKGVYTTVSFFDNLGQLFTAKLCITSIKNSGATVDTDTEADEDGVSTATTSYLVMLSDVYDEDGNSIFVKTTTDEDGNESFVPTGATVTLGSATYRVEEDDIDQQTGEYNVRTEAGADGVTTMSFYTKTGEFARIHGEKSGLAGETSKYWDKGIVLSIDPGTGENAIDNTFNQYNSDTDSGGVIIDFSALTQYSGSTNITYVKGDTDGKGVGNIAGEMKGISIDEDGFVYGTYNNGSKKCLGQIAVATFANPSGLEAVGDSLFAESLNSGVFDGVGEAVSISGSFTVGALEMSNVDLASEFTNMITTQRGFQANSRIITTTDSMLEELVNLKR